MSGLVRSYEQAWLTAKQQHDKMVADASATRTSLPDNYWQTEHKARLKMETAQRLYPAVLEALKEFADERRSAAAVRPASNPHPAPG